MTITVIIPLYNAAAYIERCLNSVIRQTHLSIECIVVDDAGSDNSRSIVEQFAASYQGNVQFQILSNQQNEGVSVSRNKGIAYATGDYIYFLDADDELPSNSLQILAEAIRKYDADVALGEVEVTGASRSSFSPLPAAKETYRTNTAVFSSYLRKEWYDMAWNKLIKKTIFSGWKEPFMPGVIHGEDSLFSFQLAGKIRSVVIIPKATYYYHIHSGSITQQKGKKNIESIYLVINEMINISCRENLFISNPELPVYLEKIRIYFIKLLLKSNLESNYIREQRQKINQLFKKNVWNKNRRKMIFLLKDFILFLWFLAYKHAILSQNRIGTIFVKLKYRHCENKT